jgi:SYP5 family syntaxin
VQLVQERNMNHPQGGPEASRLTASARRKLGSLAASLDALYAWLDGPEASEL